MKFTEAKLEEAFIELLGNEDFPHYLGNTISRTDDEVLICKSLISWVHDGSHDIADEIHVSDNDDTVQRYKGVFRAIFNSNGQLGHYNQMMGIEIEENKTT